MSTMQSTMDTTPCVCVQPLREKSGAATSAEGKPQDGDVCENSYTRQSSERVTTTTTVAMYFDSIVVSLANKSTITLLLRGCDR